MSYFLTVVVFLCSFSAGAVGTLRPLERKGFGELIRKKIERNERKKLQTSLESISENFKEQNFEVLDSETVKNVVDETADGTNEKEENKRERRYFRRWLRSGSDYMVRVRFRDRSILAFAKLDIPEGGAKYEEPVVLVHGVSRNHVFFETSASLLKSKGFAVLRMDLLNRGNTLKSTGLLKAPTLSEDAVLVQDMINRFGFKKVILIGHSRGHGVTTRLSELIPDRVVRHVGVNPFVMWLPTYFFGRFFDQFRKLSDHWFNFFDPFGFNVWGRSFNNMTTRWNEQWTKIANNYLSLEMPLTSGDQGTFSLTVREWLANRPEAERLGISTELDVKALLEVARGLSNRSVDGDEILSDYRNLPVAERTTIIYGGEDLDLAPAELVQKIKETNQKVTNVYLKDVDHMFPYRQPRRFVNLLLKIILGQDNLLGSEPDEHIGPVIGG